jgi:hypothetical protein
MLAMFITFRELALIGLPDYNGLRSVRHHSPALMKLRDLIGNPDRASAQKPYEH